MCRIMAHRGPDDEGLSFFNSNAPLHGKADASNPQADHVESVVHDTALGHRRFSIIDPTKGAHQPFWSTDNAVCVVFNGEIYNYLELRPALEKLGHSFRTTSDTEVLVAAYQAWGTNMFSRLRGFWAIALYDLQKGAVLLARDPLGKAPLYIAPTRSGIAWASEIKALRLVASSAASTPRAQAIRDFVDHGWRDINNLTCYEGITTFPAASFAWVRQGQAQEPQRYWQLRSTRLTERELSPRQAVDGFREIFYRSVTRRLHADVPWGAELSGGMDSSSIVAVAASLGHRISTFTVKFDEAHSDEEPIARTLAERFGNNIDYRVLRAPKDDFWRSADDYVALMDEPFHAPNMLTHFTLWRLMAAQGLRVSLNGAGGDELLAGYSSDYIGPFLLDLVRKGHPLQALREVARYKELPYGRVVLRELKRALWRASYTPEFDLVRTNGVSHSAKGPRRNIDELLVDLMGNWRMNYWLRSSHQSWMGVPMEVRAPFLDVDLVEFAFQLPTTYLIRDGWHKWILRQAMQDVLPKAIVARKRKMGFPFPIKEWLRGSKNTYFAFTSGLDCPYIDMGALHKGYDVLSDRNPYYLWRAMSVTLWWKRCVLGQALT